MDDCELKFKRRCKKMVVYHQDEDQDQDQQQKLNLIQMDEIDDCEPICKRLPRGNKSGVHHQQQQQQQFSNWSDLPTVLLHEIMDRLIFADDYVRFEAVCVSWRNAYQLSSKIPSSLLIPPRDYQEEEEKEEAKIPQVRSLYKFFTKMVCSDFQVPLPHNKYCGGSSFGWLVTTQRESIIHGSSEYVWYFQLLNPFLSDKHNIIDIPPIYCNKKPLEHKPDFYIHKAALSSDPLFTPKNFVLMAIMTQSRKLGFYTPNNKDWTPVCWYLSVSENLCYFDDVIYFNKTQQFYAVLGGSGQVVVVDLVKTRKGRIFPNLTNLAPPPNHEDDDAHRHWYLVETSNGELLKVAKMYEYENLFVIKRVTFEVFKFHPVEQVWTQTHNIGDDILFIGFNSSICLPSSHFPGCKSNCIYYTDDSFILMGRVMPYNPHDTGIYNMEDGTVVQHYPLASRVIFPTPILA